ncbi:TlpA family protein disulfide reductase [Mucilaginibacter rubeus]|uniref:TlpA family protein disulfide reductase n=1 Tax=Mucilaginibacter rubeus TaxID=2027860 RepID=A0AAE6JHJ9_9SPHI|nr:MULTISPECIES: TlpA disulfide reductase family protein [Mucilaginibacter]QEM04892.1 TlpA family protein disulfide reductase [Mucilaginibacter rubeus]QEM17486.1 TlpA family protein disulfide reductase [Mucilaginibacter gossypii]QTE45993.1 TlpA family protein disulfide reductase [Mucilaginibacter rubeus]QTE52590.1 TlpA family protein disulfide reductase [Mucilaginibacter rubeus]QTE57679.1 TlpA family protein disulfide reductase [Mucilaginibacter rubeus]
MSLKKIFTGITVTMLLISSLSTFGRQGFASISGNYKFINDGDIVTLTTNRFGNVSFGDGEETYVCTVIKHAFHFKINCTNEPLYFKLSIREKNGSYKSLNEYRKLGLFGYYLESGDRVWLTKKNNTVRFRGNGAGKFRVIQQLGILRQQFGKHSWGIPEKADLYFMSQDSMTIKSMAFLSNQEQSLSTKIRGLLKSSIIGTWYLKANVLEPMTDSMRTIAVKSLRSYKNPYSKIILNYIESQYNPLFSCTDEFAQGIIEQYKNDSCYMVFKKFDTKRCYDYLLRNFSGDFLDRLVTTLLYDRRVEPEDNSGLIVDALDRVRNSDYKNVLLQLKASNLVGAKAYDFSLSDSLESIHTLSEFKGKVVFIDFWFTGCGNCIKVNPLLARIEKKFEGRQVIFLSVNLDKARKTWIKSIQSGKYTTPYATNLYTDNLAFNHPISKFYNVTDGPTLIMIDKYGKMMIRPIDPRKDEGRNIEYLINKAIAN